MKRLALYNATVESEQMLMTTQTTVDNYQTIGLLFLSFPLFGKAVKKILEENTKPPANSWNIVFLQKFYKKKNTHRLYY